MTSPAPESSTPKWPNGTEQRKNGDCYFCGFPKHQHIKGTDCPPKETEYQAMPKPTPASCSEVVERLRKEAYHRSVIDDPCHVMPGNISYAPSRFDSDKAEEILHEWRERRVQELENCLGEIALTLKVGHGVGVAEQCRLYAENTLAKSDEWREQIRKGANHE